MTGLPKAKQYGTKCFESHQTMKVAMVVGLQVFPKIAPCRRISQAAASGGGS
jgi:hypothetical protein